MIDMPITNSPSTAMMTVVPANSTARPAVSIAATTASLGVQPVCRPSR